MSPRSSRTRRWRVQPVPTPMEERLTSAALLGELEGESGTLLWRALRAVCAWGRTPPADRDRLFLPGSRDQRMADLLAAALPAALERPLLVLVEMLGDPVGIAPDRVGIACLTVAAWARGAGKPTTALAFTHAGALACPGNPSYALAAARESRNAGEIDDAEALYLRAVALARQVADWDSYARAHAALGKLALGRGAYPAARRSLLRAMGAAERHGLRHLRGLLLHELFVVEMDCGNFVAAERYAAAAVGAYGPRHAMLRVLAFDIAVFWMNQERYGEALPVFLRLVPALDAEGRVMGWGDIARAAGGVGDAELFERARREVAAAAGDSPRRLDALRETAYGAMLLGRLELAESLAREAAALARERDDHKTVFVLDGLLEEVERRRGAAPGDGQETCGAAPAGSPLSESLLRALDAVPG